MISCVPAVGDVSWTRVLQSWAPVWVTVPHSALWPPAAGASPHLHFLLCSHPSYVPFPLLHQGPGFHSPSTWTKVRG